MISDVLEDLDAAIGQRCACLCGTPLSDTSPSAYFASERCSRRWHAAKGRPVPPPVRRPFVFRGVNHHLVVFDEAFGFGPVWVEVHAACQAVCAAVMTAAAELASHFHEQVASVVAFGRPAVEEPPTDPWERALWLRRRRNTGPKPPARVPRQVGPAGGLRAAALGRRPYQPPHG